MWHVYILKCSDKTLYTGCTNDLTARIKKHNAGKASRYTRARLPVKLVYSRPVRGRSAALKKEHQIKGFTREQKLSLLAK